MTHLVDTSAWVDYLRGLDTEARAGVRGLLAEDDPDVVTIEPVAMELLAGAPDEPALAQLTRLVDGLPSLPLEPTIDYRSAAAILRACRRHGRPVRNLADCLIAAVALRHGVTLAHKDADFDTIASVTPLSTLSWR